MDLYWEEPIFVFNPQPDITTYELALCLQACLELVNNSKFRYEFENWVKDKGIERHFIRTDTPQLLIKEARLGTV